MQLGPLVNTFSILVAARSPGEYLLQLGPLLKAPGQPLQLGRVHLVPTPGRMNLHPMVAATSPGKTVLEEVVVRRARALQLPPSQEHMRLNIARNLVLGQGGRNKHMGRIINFLNIH